MLSFRDLPTETPAIPPAHSFYLARNAIRAVERADFNTAAALFRRLHDQGTSPFPKAALAVLAHCAESRRWDGNELAALFGSSSFVGKDGAFIFVGPVGPRRTGDRGIQLTGACGKVIQFPGSQFTLNDPDDAPYFNDGRSPNVLIPFVPYGLCGRFGGSNAEAFIPGNFWRLDGSEYGPALLNVETIRERMVGAGRRCIEKIFVPDAAKEILSTQQHVEYGRVLIAAEYWSHEAGHASGISVGEKYRNRVFAAEVPDRKWLLGAEEWRGDAMGFCPDQLPWDDVVLTNWLLRFGVDAHRPNGLNDVDVLATLITFDTLLQGGHISVKCGNQIDLIPHASWRAGWYPEPDVRAIAYTLLERGRQITDAEIKLAREGGAVSDRQLRRIYSVLSITPDTVDFFMKAVVEPCKGIHHDLK